VAEISSNSPDFQSGTMEDLDSLHEVNIHAAELQEPKTEDDKTVNDFSYSIDVLTNYLPGIRLRCFKPWIDGFRMGEYCSWTMKICYLL
jgi:hypothetical protein